MKEIKLDQPSRHLCDESHRWDVWGYSPLSWCNSDMRFFWSSFLGRFFSILDLRPLLVRHAFLRLMMVIDPEYSGLSLVRSWGASPKICRHLIYPLKIRWEISSYLPMSDRERDFSSLRPLSQIEGGISSHIPLSQIGWGTSPLSSCLSL